MKINTFKIRLYRIFIFLIIALSGACTDDIVLPLDTTFTRLVVDGAITTDTLQQQIVLKKSGDPLNKEPLQYISNALVSISTGTDTFKLSEDTINKGVYKTLANVHGTIGKKYKLTISKVDINNDGIFETYSATDSIKRINPIDSFKVLYQVLNPDMKGWLILLYSRDIGGRNFYAIKIKINDKLITDSLHEIGISPNTGFEGKYYSGLTVYFLNQNKKDEKVKKGDKITLELEGITEDYFNFLDAYKQEFQPKIPIFSGPSANAPTNILSTNKAVGYFEAYSIQRKTIIY